MKYNFDTCTNFKQWDDFVLESAQGSVYNLSWFLNICSFDYKIYVLTDNYGIIMSGIVIFYDNHNRILKSPLPLIPYQSILFSKSINDLNEFKRNTIQLTLSSFLIDKIILIHNSFSSSLSPYYNDIRPFLWYNYNSKNIFSVLPRYTAILNLSNINCDTYLNNIRKTRRYEYNISKNVIVRFDDVTNFVEIYKNMFFYKEIHIPQSELFFIEKIIVNALSLGYGKMYASINYKNELEAINFYLFDNKTVYYQFGVRNFSINNNFNTTKLIVDNIFSFKNLNFNFFDFVGVNSPDRGDYKMSFNPTLRSYYVVNYSL